MSSQEPKDLMTEDAVAFVTDLQRRFGPRRDELLAARKARGAADATS